MALTRKFLKAMGIEDEKIDQIIEAHTDTVNGLKDSLDKAQADAKALPAVQKELDEAKEALTAAKDDGWKEKHDKVKKEFDEYKAGITAKETKAAKESAARAYYEGKNITGKALDIAMRGSAEEISALALGEDGKIKDTAALDALVKGTFSGLVGQTTTKGAETADPPVNNGGRMSKDDIFKIKDPTERQNAIAANIDIFKGKDA